jgi:hypothetical protein
MGWTNWGSIHDRKKKFLIHQLMQTQYGAYTAAWMGTQGAASMIVKLATHLHVVLRL